MFNIQYGSLGPLQWLHCIFVVWRGFQGAIQGPEEFVEGMALGVKALVGGAVGKNRMNVCI